MRVPLLVLILVLGSIPMQVEATSGRALSVNIEMQENIEQEWDFERPLEAPDLVEWK